MESSVADAILDKLDIKDTSPTRQNAFSPHGAKQKPLDLESEELFPSLSSKPVNGKAAPLQYRKMAASAPAAPRAISSQVTDRLEIPYELQARQSPFGKQNSPSDICKEVMSKHGVSIEISTNRKNGLMTCLITGKSSNVIAARHELSRLLTIQVKAEVAIPAAVRPHLVGKKGANLKALMARTFTNISLPSRKKASEENNAGDVDGKNFEAEENDADDDAIVTITGDAESVALAKKEIEELVASRAAKYSQKVDIDASYQQFVAGPNQSNLEKLQEEFNVRIHMPPLDMFQSAKNGVCDIVVVGEKSDVQAVISRISENYENLKRTIRTISIPVRKKQHRFIVGPKGSSLQEIFAKTGCFVDIPPQADTSDSVNVRGPEAMLSLALQLVLEKANSILIDEVNVTALLPISANSSVFMRFLNLKEKSKLKEIESEYDVNFFQQSQDKTVIMEIQAKTRASLEASSLKFQTLVRDLGRSLFIGVVDIPHGLHRFILGKGGQNVQKIKASPSWEGRLIDIVFFPESEESDDVLIVVKRGSSKSLQESDKEATNLVSKIKDSILADAQNLADLVTTVIRIDPKYHARVIGTGGSTLNEILAPFDKAVSVKFVSANAKAKDEKVDVSAVTIRGLKDDVAKVSESIMKIVSELKHIEVMTSFSEEVLIDNSYTARLVGENKHTAKLLSWTVKRIREQYNDGKLKLGNADKHFEKDLKGTTGFLYLTAELSPAGKDRDSITIKGPKTFVAAAKSLIEHRYQELKDTAIETFDIFEIISSDAKAMLRQVKDDLKASIFPRLIGKEGKTIKKLQDRHAVYIKFGRDSEKVEGEEAAQEDDDLSGEITIRGGRSGVAGAKKEIVDFVQNLILGSFVLTFKLPKSTRATIVGRAGSNIAEFKDKYDVRIDINDIEDNDEEIEIVLEGQKSDCLAIKKQIESNVDDLINASTVEVVVPLVLHRLIIGVGGANVRKFIDTYGGPDKVRVKFPKSCVNEPHELQTVSITANVKVVDDVVSAFRQLIVKVVSEASVPGFTGDSKFNKVWSPEENGAAHVSLSLPKADVPFIFGRIGDFAVGFMKRYGVTIWTNEHEDSESDTVEVTIVGASGSAKVLEEVKQQIQGKKRASKTVSIPEELLQLFRSENPYHVDQVSYLSEVTRRVKAETSVQLDLSPGTSSGKAKSTITIRGESSRVDKGAALLSKLLDQWKSKKYLSKLSIPAEYRPHIIGRGGQTINRIRDESGAVLDLVRPKPGSKETNDTLLIRAASQDQIDKAIGIVKQLMSEQAERLKRDQERAAQRQQATQAAASTVGAARIDDEDDNVSASGKSNGVSSYVPPGYVGKKSVADVSSSIRIASAVSVSNRSLSTESFSFFSAPQEPSGWKEVGKKSNAKNSTQVGESGADGSANGPPEDVPGLSSSSKKKKKNKKKASDETSHSIPGVTAPTSPTADDLAAIAAVLAEKPSASSYVEAKKPDQDEWQEVPSSRKSRQATSTSVAPDAVSVSADGDGASSKKKKKKKNGSAAVESV